VSNRPIGTKVEEAIRKQLDAGHDILKVAMIVGYGSGTVQRIKRKMTVA
jgi:tagatose-1,6-bisphosphate aldolase